MGLPSSFSEPRPGEGDPRPLKQPGDLPQRVGVGREVGDPHSDP